MRRTLSWLSGLRTVLVIKGGCDSRGSPALKQTTQMQHLKFSFHTQAPFPNFPASPLASQPSNTIKLLPPVSSVSCIWLVTKSHQFSFKTLFSKKFFCSWYCCCLPDPPDFSSVLPGRISVLFKVQPKASFCIALHSCEYPLGCTDETSWRSLGNMCFLKIYISTSLSCFTLQVFHLGRGPRAWRAYSSHLGIMRQPVWRRHSCHSPRLLHTLLVGSPDLCSASRSLMSPRIEDSS